MKQETPELLFASRSLFREWLERNRNTSGGVWLVFDKSKSRGSLTANEALEEALCFGWIDGQMQSVDETKYLKYFAKRRPNSVWSEKNKKLVGVLREKGLMTASGEEAVKAAVQNGQWASRSSPPTSSFHSLRRS